MGSKEYLESVKIKEPEYSFEFLRTVSKYAPKPYPFGLGGGNDKRI